jgi:large subunit ribosomal protein L14
MRGLGARIPKGLTAGSQLTCDDNSGAKVVAIIGVAGWRGKLRRYPAAGISDVIIVSVKKGSVQMRKKVVRAVIVRQRKEFRRPDGMRISFEDNAAVLVDDQGLPVGSEIKGAVAREVAERFPKVAAIAPIVI